MKQINRIIAATITLLVVTTANAQIPCDTITGKICRSIVTDTAYNPYVTGVLGNWRANKSYTWYSKRTENDADVSATDIRKNGTFASFTSFWQFAGNKLVAQPDTTRWVWNSEIDMINRKGLEVENKDPLGRYNAGLYGYNLTLPTAVMQNSRYRESVFEGFEDYDFVTQVCDTGCFTDRHIDYSPYKAHIDTTQRHTGKSSFRIDNDTLGLSFALVTMAGDTADPSLRFNLITDTCVPGDKALGSIKSTSNVLLPVFSPYRGQRMVISAWVRESHECNCTSYTNNHIIVAFSAGNTSSFSFTPQGNIIEGWQRYESVFTIPADAGIMTVSLAADTAAVYFDDLRIHPYNANMKSFVYHPVNLRLMAELDENNYATLYEYDDDGTLIRLKKETERGIKTIKETRSALLKQ